LCFVSLGSPEIYTINPLYASSVGGDAIAIVGAQFFQNAQMNCVFNGTIVTTAAFKSASLILCLSPALSLIDTSEVVTLSVAVVLEGIKYPASSNFVVYGA
jgi:hypothetical protein